MTTGDYWQLPLLTLLAGLVLLVGLAVIGRRVQWRWQRAGLATRRQMAEALSIGARRDQASRLRPAFTAQHDLRKVADPELGISLGQAVHTRQALWSSFEDVIGLIAPPRAGKTAMLTGVVRDAPGAVLVTSTRVDVHANTAVQRAARGPAYVFNPSGLGGLASTLRWSPIVGCEDAAVAERRAAALLAGSSATKGTEDRDFWQASSFRVLRSYLYAAAVSGSDMWLLSAWATSPHDREALNIITAEASAPFGWAADLEQILSAPERTLQSIFLTLSQTFSFSGQESVMDAVCPAAGSPTFDADDFVAGNGTLYLLGADRKLGSLAPLISALTTEVYERAIAAASMQPHGRLDPPLTLVLDEVASICPVPLETWTSVAGGWGIPIAYAIQAPSQLAERWGKLAGATIWNNTTILLILGGLKDVECLRQLSELTGQRAELTETVSRGGLLAPAQRSQATRLVPVLSPADIRTLKQWQALVLYRNTPPLLTRLTPLWKR